MDFFISYLLVFLFECFEYVFTCIAHVQLVLDKNVPVMVNALRTELDISMLESIPVIKSIA